MRRNAVAAIAVGLLLAPAFVPAPAGAERGHGRSIARPNPVSHPARHFGRHPVPHSSRQFGRHSISHPPRHFGRHRPQHRHRGRLRAAWPLFYAAPPLYSSGLVYYDPFAYSAAPAYVPPVSSAPGAGTISLAPAPAPPAPTPSVIEYPGGRYELRGDGVNTPYTWVWIPNPPPPPSAAAPPPEPPSPEAGSPSRAVDREFYRWIDEQGVAHWTNQWDAIPERHRGQATRFPAG
jgi:hypothetical protein